MERRLSREELVELVRRIMRAEGTEAEQDDMLRLLEKNVPHPDVSDLIYYAEHERTAEEVVDEALRYKPIQLP